jgi:hypothetical protein
MVCVAIGKTMWSELANILQDNQAETGLSQTIKNQQARRRPTRMVTPTHRINVTARSCKKSTGKKKTSNGDTHTQKQSYSKK